MTDKQNESKDLSTQVEAADSAPANGKTSSLPLVLALIALILVLAVFVGGYFIWHEVNRQATWQQGVLAQMDTRNSALDERFKTLSSSLQAELAETRRDFKRVEDSQQDQKSSQAGLEQALGMLRSQVGRSQDEWVLAEARYLLHVANQRIELQRDRDTALAALLSADQRLLSLGEASYLPVRRKIADEVNQLRAVEIPDINGMALELQQLAEQVHELRMQGSHYVPTKPEDMEVEGDAWRPESLKEAPAALVDLFKEVFVLQPVDKPVGPMLPPESRYFIYSNLKLQLEAARLALLSLEAGAYQSSLQSAAQWLKDYFDTENPATSAMQESLARLSKVDIKPAFPDVSGSLKLLREEMRLAETREPPVELPDEKIITKESVEPAVEETGEAQVESAP